MHEVHGLVAAHVGVVLQHARGFAVRLGGESVIRAKASGGSWDPERGHAALARLPHFFLKEKSRALLYIDVVAQPQGPTSM